MDSKEFFCKLLKKSEKINEIVSSKESEKFYKYMMLLVEWNEKMNLTAITEPNDIILKHFVDSITVNRYIKEKEKIIDIGTGAGFPGIPIKILNNESEVTLVDSLNKRINFLNEVKKELELKKLYCIHARVEELAKNIEYREIYDVTTSRAVAKLNVLVEYMLPFVKIGGICVCMKGAEVEEEIKEAKNAISILGGKLEEINHFYLPDSDIERNIIVIRKIKKTPVKFPRKSGMPAKQPIV